MNFEITPQRSYTAALDSVALIGELLAKPSLTNEEKATARRNAEHLQIQVDKGDWYDGFDMAPFTSAIAAVAAANL